MQSEIEELSFKRTNLEKQARESTALNLMHQLKATFNKSSLEQNPEDEIDERFTRLNEERESLETYKDSLCSIINPQQLNLLHQEIVQYKGVQDSQITVDGITIEPAAKSEDDRIEYIPTAELDIDSRKKYIKIPIVDLTYKIAGSIVEQNTFKRQMVYTITDIAYLPDIEALNKKIEALAVIPHKRYPNI